MGNRVSAASPPESGAMDLSPPPLQPPPPPMTAAPASTDEKAQAEDTNPGTFEELHRKCKDLFPQTFEGGKFIVSKGLSSHFQISHTINMSTIQPSQSGYRFGATYIGSKQYSPQEAYPVLIGDMDASGNLNANIIHAFTKQIRCKLVTQFQEGKCAASQGTLDYRGEDFTSSVTVGNLDIFNNSGIVVGQYLQNVTSRLALGAELLCQYGPNVPGREFTALSLAAKLNGDKWQLSGNVCPATGVAHACYYHKINEQLQVGGEVETSLAGKESVGKAVYQLEIPNANVTFRGTFDTNWTAEAVLEKKLLPMPFTFAVCGIANFANIQKSQYRFGIGLILG